MASVREFLLDHPDLRWISIGLNNAEPLEQAVPSEAYLVWLTVNAPRWQNARCRTEGPQLLAEFRVGGVVNWQTLGQMVEPLAPPRWPNLESYLMEEGGERQFLAFINNQLRAAIGLQWKEWFQDDERVKESQEQEYSDPLQASVTVTYAGRWRTVHGIYIPDEDDKFTYDSYVLTINHFPVWKRSGTKRHVQLPGQPILYRTVEKEPGEDQLQFHLQPASYIATLNGHQPTKKELDVSGKEIFEGYRCLECGKISRELGKGGPLFKCKSCGEQFIKDNSIYLSHRCFCGRMAGKVTDTMFCSICEAGEVEAVEVIEKEDRLVAIDEL